MQRLRGKIVALQGAVDSNGDFRLLILSLAIAFVLIALGIMINFSRPLAALFETLGAGAPVEWITNFLVVWLALLLVLAYLRWSRVVRQNQELQDIISSISPDVLLVVDVDRNILMANSSATRMFGYQIPEIVGQKTDVLYFDRRTKPGVKHEVYEALERDGFHVGLATGKRKNGEVFPLEVITGLLRLHGGGVVLLRDIADRKKTEDALVRSEEQLRQSQKMEAVGRLAGGVAHDFNNLLTTILGFSNLAIEGLPAEHPVRKDIEEVVRGAERATILTRQLLTFSRKESSRMTRLDLNAVVAGMDPMLRRTLGEDIVLATVLGEDLGLIEGDTSGLEQVILNLAVNARDAMPQGGKLVIQTTRVELDEDRVRQWPGAQPGAWVMLTMRDTGCGMTPEVYAHVFEPFFTTKRKGEGTGLGLSTVYGVVQQCHGHIELTTEAGVGTEFRIFFRPCAEGPSEMEKTSPTAALPRGMETVLVVDDEYTVRSFTVRILRSLGYTVLEAGSAGDALAICERHKDPIALVITDVVMPRVGGRSLVDHIRQVRSAIKVLYVSGFTGEALAHHGVSESETPVLTKPYTRETLAQRVREALDAPLPKA
jgi:two-component system, cell cycle sensor histidine kinase and response regulator CckA